MSNELGLTPEQEKALADELAYLKKSFAESSVLRGLPSIQRRQDELSTLLKHVKAVRIFADKLETDKLVRKSLQDMVLALGILTDVAVGAVFIEGWFRESRAVEKIIEATLKHTIDPMRGMKIPPPRLTLIAKILPALFEKITGERFSKTREGRAFRFIHYCLEALGEPSVTDETIMTVLRPSSGNRRKK
jgi:hypothetical protein